MTKLKLIVAAMIVAIFTAGVPSGASAHYYHIKKIKVVGGKHFGGGGGPWPIFVCSGGIITSALVANATQNRELTWNEAASCGLLYWVNLPQ